MHAGDAVRALARSTSERGSLLLDIPESQWFERKSIRIEPRRLAEALVGFANADGGIVAVGLSAGKVEGVRSQPKRLNDLMQVPLDLTQPTVTAKSTPVSCVRDDGTPDELLVFEIAPSRSVHATTRDEVFLRVGDETRRLTFAQRRELLFDKGQSTYEVEQTSLDADDLDAALLSSYAASLEAPDPYRLLEARGLIDAGHLTIAGCLLFAREPGRVLPNAHIRVSRFRGTHREYGSRQNLMDDIRIEGPIPPILDRARDQVRDWQPTRRALAASGRFEDIGLVPEEVWLEGLVNAAVHRSYSIAGDHIHVDIFDDKIVIESPGRFPGLVDLTRPFATTRFARNPRIARVCSDLRIGQELGEGIRRMFQEMRDAGLGDPLYHQTSGSVQLTLSGEPAQRKIEAQLPATSRLITNALRSAERLSTGEVADLLDVSRPTATRHLQALQEAGLVEWVGNSARDPRAYWRLAH